MILDTYHVQALLFVDDTLLVMKTEEDCKHNIKSMTMTTTTAVKTTTMMMMMMMIYTVIAWWSILLLT